VDDRRVEQRGVTVGEGGSVVGGDSGVMKVHAERCDDSGIKSGGRCGASTPSTRRVTR